MTEEFVQIKKEDWEKVQTVIGSVEGITNDLKTERQARIDAEAARDLAIAKGKETVVTPPADEVTAKATEVVKTMLGEREKEEISTNFKAAESAFLSAHQEFHPDSDPGGIKLAAFKAKLARINLVGLKTVDDFRGAFDEAATLMNPGQVNRTIISPDASTPRGGGGLPNESKTTALSAKEQQLIQTMGWDEARYLKIKTSKPSYVASLLKHLE